MKKKIAILFAILGLIILLIGIILIITPNQKEDKNNTVKENINLTPENYSKYYSEVMSVSNYFDLYLVEKYPLNNIDNLSSEEKTMFILDVISGLEGNEITVDRLKKEMKKYFKNVEIYKHDIKKDGEIIYEYKNNTFTKVKTVSNNCTNFTEVIENKGNPNNWILKKKIYFMSINMNNGIYHLSIYRTNADCNNNTNEITSFDNNNYIITQEQYNTFKDKLNIVNYNYKANNDDYFMNKITIEQSENVEKQG